MKTALLFPLLSLVLFSSCQTKTPFDSVDYAIMYTDTICFQGGGVKICVEPAPCMLQARKMMEKIKPSSKEYADRIADSLARLPGPALTMQAVADQQHRTGQSSGTVPYNDTTYPGGLAGEMAWQKQSALHTDSATLKRLRFARYYYTGCLKTEGYPELRIYADVHKNVTAVELEHREKEMTETFMFNDNRVFYVKRFRQERHSEGFMLHMHYDYDNYSDNYRFIGNRLYEITKTGKDAQGKNTFQTTKNIPGGEQEKLLKTAYFFKALAQNIINDPKIDCQNTKARFEGGTNKEIIQYFNSRFDSAAFADITSTVFYFNSYVQFKVSAAGSVDSILMPATTTTVVMGADHRPLAGQEEYYARTANEVRKILKTMKWQTATKNCTPEASTRSIRVAFNTPHTKGKYYPEWDLPGKFAIAVDP